MTTPHLLEPPTLAARFADIELSPMSRKRYNCTAMRIGGHDEADLVVRVLRFKEHEEKLNAQPEWSWDTINDCMRVTCEVRGVQYGGTRHIPPRHVLEEAGLNDEVWIVEVAKEMQRVLEHAVARFVLYGAR